MTVLAYGTKQVRELERAMAGAPPKGRAKAPMAALDRYMDELFKRQRARLAESSRLAERWRQAVLPGAREDEAKLKQLKAEAKAQFDKRSKQKRDKPKPLKFEPRFIVGSTFLLKAPPYDGAWQWANDSHVGAQSNAAAGTCDLGAQSFGDHNREGAAGFFAWFLAPEDNPMQRFAALVQYSYDWWDDASGYVAHNDLRTRLWVWGQTENRWVGQSEGSPAWSDGVGWFESHGNTDSGTVSNEMFFPAAANQWYQGWVWSDASAYADGGFWGIADSSVHFDSVVPFVVFGSL
jgi:hypothetical protein